MCAQPFYVQELAIKDSDKHACSIDLLTSSVKTYHVQIHYYHRCYRPRNNLRQNEGDIFTSKYIQIHIQIDCKNPNGVAVVSKDKDALNRII